MDNNETLDEEFFSELLEDNEILELLDFALLEDDSATLLLEDDEILELLDVVLLEEEAVTLLLEDNEILELLDFALLEDDSAILQEDTDEYSSSPPIGAPVAVQATKKAETKPARSILKTDLFIREIYIKTANTATHARPPPSKELYCAKTEIG